jgi:putative PIN family toxin of toxin-antitoxin system
LNPPQIRAVFDAVVFVQALISRRGPAAACFDRINAGQAILFTSDALLDEARSVPMRPELTRRYSRLTPERIEAFINAVRATSVNIPSPPKVFALPRDPKDEICTDLAVAASAQFLVTWNERHLTYLMKQDTPEGKDFCKRFPQLSILNPPNFLHELDMIHGKTN